MNEAPIEMVEGEEPAPEVDPARALKAIHEAMEVAFGDESFASALLSSPKGSWEIGDDGSITLMVGDATVVVDAATLDAAMAGDEPVEEDMPS